MLGWYNRIDYLVQIHRTFAPMQFNTALGFLLSSLSIILLVYKYNRGAAGLAILVFLLAAVTASQYIFGFSAHIDELFMHHYLSVNTSHQGRMAPNTALCFMLVSSALIWGSVSPKIPSTPIIVTAIASLVLGLATIALFGYVTGYVAAYGWSSFTRMAVHTSVGFVLLCLSLMIYYRPNESLRKTYQHWLLAGGMPFLFASLILLQVVLEAERITAHREILVRDTKTLSSLMAIQLRDMRAEVSRMAKRWTADGRTNENVWRSDANIYSEELKLFRSIGWVDPSMIVRWVEPLAGNEADVGLNFSFEPVRKETLIRSKMESRTLYSPEVKQGPSGNSLAIFCPLTVGQKFGGWLYGVLMIHELLEPYVEVAKEKGYALTFHQHDANDEAFVVHESDGIFDESALNYFEKIAVSGQEWSLGLQITPRFYEIHRVAPSTIIILFLEMFLLIAWLWVLRQSFHQREQKLLLDKLYSRQTSTQNTMMSGLIVVNNDGKILEVNEATRNIFNYQLSDLIGVNIAILMPQSFGADDEIYQAQYHRTIVSKFAGSEHQLTAVRNGGQHFPVHVKVSEGINEQENFFTCIFEDISEEHAAQEQLQKKRALLKVAVDASSVGFAIHNLEGDLIEVNDAFCHWIGYAREELLSIKLYDLLAPAEYDSSIGGFERLAKGDTESIHRDIVFIHKSGKSIWGKLSASIFQTSNHSEELFVNQIIDIGKERLLTSELQEKNTALEKSNADLDQFAYVASHDLKSPLNAIKKIALWLEEDCGEILPEESREHLSLLVSRTDRMAKLLDDLLAYSRVGSYQYQQETINLKAVVTGIFEMLNDSGRFSVTCDDENLCMPRVPFELVLRNLLSNAIKHHDKPEGKIAVALEVQGESYRFSVSDNGPGIPVDMHEKVLEMFQTLKPRDQVEGSGMGLALVKKVVEHYGGGFKHEVSIWGGVSAVFTWPMNSKTDANDPADQHETTI
tara:strand:- start:116645 stop:119548 length:2904 start_codon:yes stop_codon:yes gene_type:complete